MHYCACFIPSRSAQRKETPQSSLYSITCVHYTTATHLISGVKKVDVE